MPTDSKKKRYNLRNKSKKEKDKTCKTHSDNGADNKPDDDEEEELNSIDYKKLLQKIFPSKHLDDTIKKEEKKKVFDKMKKNGSKKDEIVYLEEEFIPYNKCSIKELKAEIKNRGIKGANKTSNKKDLI